MLLLCCSLLFLAKEGCLAQKLVRMEVFHPPEQMMDTNFLFSKAKNTNRVSDLDIHPLKTMEPFSTGPGSPVVNISIGNPPQYFKIALVVGFPYPSCIASTQCESSFCEHAKRYNHSASSTYIEDGRKYTDAGMKGFLSKDMMCLKEACVSTLPFIELLEVNDAQPAKHAIDGAMGIQHYNNPAMPSILEQLYNEKKISNHIFSLWSNGTNSTSFKGEAIFGGIDESLFEKPMIWTDIVGSDVLGVPVDKISVGNKSEVCSDGCLAVITSMYMIAGPFYDIEAIHYEMDADCAIIPYRPCIVKCEDISKLPVISLIINGHPFELLPIHYVKKRGNKCYSRFVYTGEYADWLIGRPFLERYYTAIDFDQHKIGFAKNRLK